MERQRLSFLARQASLRQFTKIATPTSRSGRVVVTLFMMLLTTTTAWAGDVTLEGDATNGYYVCMPKSGHDNLTLDGSVTTFKVYNNGGKANPYYLDSNGKLVLTAPDGYVLQLSGTVTTDARRNYVFLTVYDNGTGNGTTLLSNFASTIAGVRREITPFVVSSGRNMTLHFFSDHDNNHTYDGLNLTVKLINASTEFDVNVGTATGGNVTSNKSTAKVHESVTLTASPSDGNVLNGITVKDGSNNNIPVDWNVWTNSATFKMPASAVTITPTFTNSLTSLSVNMPVTGTKTATIPVGVQSIKVYDDGGENDSYSNECDGTLVLVAPEDYYLKLTGRLKTRENNGRDYLSVYDGTGTSGTVLIDKRYGVTTSDGFVSIVSGSSEGVTTTGRSMTLLFHSADGLQTTSDGLDLTAALVPNQHCMKHATISDINSSYLYSGSAISITPAVTASDNTALALGTDFTATLNGSNVTSFPFNITADGNYTLTVTGTGTQSSGYYGSQTFNFTVLYCPEGLTIDNDYNVGEDGFFYVNIPATSTSSVTLSNAIVTSFKVYDHGGKNGQYSNNCHGTLKLKAPTGYVLQLSGNIITETGFDYLTVYDNSEASGTKLLDAVSSTSDGTQTFITPVASTGQDMTLYFYSDNGSYYDGLDLTVTLVDPNTTHNITVNTAAGGSIAASVGGNAATTAKANETITLTATPASGYLLSNISVADASYGNAIPVTDMLWYTNTNSATFKMPASAVTVTPTFTNTLTAAGGLYVNMPTTGSKEVIIPAGVQSFKVYDAGGSEGDYSDYCNGTLVLKAPTGYMLQLSGNIMTQKGMDELTVYDNNEASGTKLLNAVSSTSSGTPTAIATVSSTGQYMTLYFYSNEGLNYAGLDLTVTLISTSTNFDINGLGTATGGSIAASVGGNAATTAKANETVTLTVTPASGYVLTDISVVDANNNPVVVAWDGLFSNTATFTMPTLSVTVTPTFTNDQTSLSINMPAHATKSVTIPVGIKSFKVYDDGGATGQHSKNCSGTLKLKAPTGYVLQLSGNVTVNTGWSSLQVYDGDNLNADRVLTGVSNPSGTLTAINTVMSSGQDMTLYFYSGSTQYDGLDLTVTVVKVMALADNADNSEDIGSWNGGLANVTLADRTLTKDGNWNTLCLPFAVTAAQMAETTHPLYGATIKELDNSATGTKLDAGVLTLKFKTVTAIEAGKPYIVKWTTTGSNISNPVFNDVTISNTAAAEVESDDKNVKFVGQYSPFDINDANKNEILYVASGNKIGYSAKARTLKSCRAHFWVKPNDTNAPAVNSINIDWGEGETTEITTTNFTNSTNSDEWYTLDGRKLNAKPNAKGVYINNGRKTVIK